VTAFRKSFGALAGALGLALLVTTAIGSPATASASVASVAAVDPSTFDPALIISDQNFYDGDALDAVAVQRFLDTKVPACAPGIVCLADYTQDTVTRPADELCDSYRGRQGETSAEIIAKVGEACGISQKALLVLLQKEQSLVDNPAPTPGDFSFATGYACPDTAACDTEYSGFYNQLYWAAWQLKRYANPPGTSDFFTWHPVGEPSPVGYNPDAACGSADVVIANLATAALYYYTPYQPNPATASGTPNDPCGAYGNLNFWRLYSEWFGDARLAGPAVGDFEDVSVTRGRIVARGWAVDPLSYAAPTSVRVTVTDAAGRSKTTTVRADDTSKGGLSVSPLAGRGHGFVTSLETAQGVNRVCITALPIRNESSTTGGLGCKTIFALTP
jgi:hypothetical protein